MTYSVLLDTSFFIRLLNDNDPLHQNARDYFRYFLDHEIGLRISTISIAEYCVKGALDELPLKNLQVVPFNIDHAKKTGEFANIVFTSKNVLRNTLSPRAVIPNDSKLFAQADTDPNVTHFVLPPMLAPSMFSRSLRSRQRSGSNLLTSQHLMTRYLVSSS